MTDPVTNGSVTNGSVTDGSVTDGSVTDGSVTNGSVTDGSTAHGSVTDSSVTDSSRGDGSTVHGSERPWRRPWIGRLPRVRPQPGHGPRSRGSLRWWRELLYCLAFYGAYTVVRDVHGTRPVSTAHAFANAERIIDLEQVFGVFQERRIQAWFLHAHVVVRIFDDFYGSAHFIITFAVLLYLFRRQASRYPLWRNTLAITTGLALIGFAVFPLMPPRLLPAHYHFVDTLRAIGGFWSFESGPMTKVSNQFAAMPSLHFGWALWCALAISRSVRNRVVRVVVWLYPLVTLLCIVVTANHYFADAAGGAVTFGVAYAAARGLDRWRRRGPGLPRPHGAESPAGPPADGLLPESARPEAVT